MTKKMFLVPTSTLKELSIISGISENELINIFFRVAYLAIKEGNPSNVDELLERVGSLLKEGISPIPMKQVEEKVDEMVDVNIDYYAEFVRKNAQLIRFYCDLDYKKRKVKYGTLFKIRRALSIPVRFKDQKHFDDFLIAYIRQHLNKLGGDYGDYKKFIRKWV